VIDELNEELTAEQVFMPWLFDQRGVFYDAMHQFVDKDGYRLSDRVWRASARTRNAIDRLVTYEVSQGTSAVRMAGMLEQFLQKERAGVRTKKPYGRWGSYDARRLARTEITAAHGRATIASAAANPFVQLIEWALSLSHEEWDCNCEENSEKDLGDGPGIYPVDGVPRYPDHPH